MTAGARRFLDACICLDGVLAFEGLGPLPDPDEPGAALCHAARNVIPAWRQPSGSSDYRDATVRAFITATGLVSAGALGLATYAPRRTSIDLQAALASLAEVVADLSAAIGEPAADPSATTALAARCPTAAAGRAGSSRDRGQAPQDRMASFRANNQRAIAALEAVAAYAQTLPAGQLRSPPPARSATSSACPGCSAEYGTSPTSSPGSASARSATPRTNSTGGPGPPRRARPPGRRPPRRPSTSTNAPRPRRMRRPGGIWPADTLAELDGYASSRGISRGGSRRPAHRRAASPASGSTPTTRAWTSARRWPQGLRAHAQQCLSAYGPSTPGSPPTGAPPRS